MLDSYDDVLLQNGTSLQQAWPRYALWNYLTGTRSIPGLSYLDAAGYPNAPLTAVTSVYPFQQVSAVDRLAAEYIQCSGFPEVTGTLDVAFQRDSSSDLRLFSVAQRRDGQIVVTEHPNADNLVFALSTSLDQLNGVGFVVANGEYSPGPVGYTLDVSTTIEPPAPLLVIGAGSIDAYLATGSVAQSQLEIRNDGNATSQIDFEIHLMESLPPANLLKSVAGSEIVPGTMSYTAGDTLLLSLSLDNNSPDGEWMSGATVSAPAGVTVLQSTDFVAPSGTLQSDYTVGDGATVTWFDLDGGYGEVRNGQTATAQLTLALDAELWGDLDFGWSLAGDQWDQEPQLDRGRVHAERARRRTPSLGGTPGWLLFESRRADLASVEQLRIGGAGRGRRRHQSRRGPGVGAAADRHAQRRDRELGRPASRFERHSLPRA